MKKLRLWILLLPFALYYLGAGMNILAVTANNGGMPVYMPVTWPGACDESIDVFGMKLQRHVICEEGHVLDHKHIVAGPSTHLVILTDWIQIAGDSVVSPGDCLLWLGDWLTIPMMGAWFGLLLLKEKQ